MTPERKAVYSFESIVVDNRRLEVRRDGNRVDLEPKAFQVLSYLVENRERVVTKEELLSAIWAGTAVTDNALTRVIAQIRKQLGDHARAPRFVETVSTAGYRFIGHVVESTPSLTPSLPAPRPIPIAPSRPRWRLPAAIAGVAATAAAAWLLGRMPRSDTLHVTGLQQVTDSAAADSGPAFSPDGGQIAFASDRTGRFEIYVRSLAAASADRQLTSDGGNNVQPAWSPNGQQIAFTSQKRGGIAVISVTGGPIQYLTASGSNPNWSPDGHTLVYQAGMVGKIGLWLVGTDGAPPRRLTQPGTPPGDHQYPKWLADGRHIVFSAFFPTKGRPWIVDPATGRLHPIELAADSVLFPNLPGNGRFLYYATPGAIGAATPLDPVGIWRAPIDARWRTGAPRLLIPSGGMAPQDLVLTADGSRLALSQGRHESAIWSLPLTPAGLAAAEPSPWIRDSSIGLSEPVFSPDGSQLAFASLRQGGVWTIHIAAPDGSSFAVTPAGESGRMISWIGNHSLAYIGERQGKRDYWLAPLNGPPKRMDLKLDLGPYAFASASPQGTTLVAHAGNRSVGIKLVLVDLATGATRDLTPPGRTFVFPSWSPDGRWIAAVERVDPQTDRRVVIEVATGALQNLGDTPDQTVYFRSSWAPDNDRILFASPHEGIANIYWVSRSTGRVQQLTHFDSPSVAVDSPAWSPRGDRIAFLYRATSANIYMGELR